MDEILKAIEEEIRKHDTTSLNEALRMLEKMGSIYHRASKTLEALEHRANQMAEHGEDQIYWQIDAERLRDEKAEFWTHAEKAIDLIHSTMDSIKA